MDEFGSSKTRIEAAPLGALGEELRRSGWETTDARLAQIVARAIARCGRNHANACRLVREDIRHDAALVIELMGPLFARRLGEYVHEQFLKLNPDPRGHVGHGTQPQLAARGPDAENCGGGGHRAYDTQWELVPAAASPSEPGGHYRADPRNGAASRAPIFRPARMPLGAVTVVAALQRETITTADDKAKPLAEATAGEVRAYARRAAFKGAWLTRLVANLPDDAVVGEWRGDDDLVAARRAAREEMA